VLLVRFQDQWQHRLTVLKLCCKSKRLENLLASPKYFLTFTRREAPKVSSEVMVQTWSRLLPKPQSSSSCTTKSRHWLAKIQSNQRRLSAYFRARSQVLHLNLWFTHLKSARQDWLSQPPALTMVSSVVCRQLLLRRVPLLSTRVGVLQCLALSRTPR